MALWEGVLARCNPRVHIFHRPNGHKYPLRVGLLLRLVCPYIQDRRTLPYIRTLYAYWEESHNTDTSYLLYRYLDLCQLIQVFVMVIVVSVISWQRTEVV